MMPTIKPASNHGRSRTFILSALILAAIMFIGFAKNYYLRAWIGTRPITFMVHLHGLIMTAWVFLFLTQTLLIANGRVDLHRKLGIAGGILASIVVALGCYTIAASILRQLPDANMQRFTHLFLAFDGLSLLLFGGLVVTAMGVRLRPQIHKRLMLMAMVSLLPPAFGRFVAYFISVGVQGTVLMLMCITVGLCVVIDIMRRRRPHPALLWSGALVVAVNIVTYLAQMAE
jgi:hypothetical protein